MRPIERIAPFALVGALVGCSDAGAQGPVTVRSTAGDASTCVTPDAGAPYPTCPYGIEVGQTLENATFVGRRAGLDSPREAVSLADFHALRAAGKRYLVLSVGAFWCSPCKEEAKEFQASLVPAYEPKGVAFLSIILQNASRQPTKDDDVDLWIRTFKLTFPTARDPDGYVARFFDPSTMPLNMVVDLATMKLELKVIGADLPRVKSTLDRLLATP
jgi:cytochrome c biogenesis protein CcmG/thiol:disulfide interchange protein DsbE